MPSIAWRRCALILSAIAYLIAWPHDAWSQPTAPQPPLTLSRLLEMALSNNRRLKIADLQIEKAQNDVAATRTRQWPALDTRLFEGVLSTLDFTFQPGAWGTFPTTGPVPPQQATITRAPGHTTVISIQVSQPLTQLTAIRPGVRQLELEREMLAERRRAQAQAIATEVRRTYYEILHTRDAIAASEAEVALYTELQRQTAEQLTARTAFAADLSTVQAQLARRQHDVATLRSALATLTARLEVLVGQNLGASAHIVRTTDIPGALPRDTTPGSADLEKRPDVREAILKVRQAEENVREKRALRLPQISAVGGFLGLPNMDVLPRTVALAGVVATWDPFDWGRKRHGVAASDTLLRQSALALEERRAEARVDVDARYRQLVDAGTAIEVAERVRTAADERLQLARRRHEAQAALLSEVLAAEAARAGAEREYQQAILAWWTASAGFHRALGEM